MSGSTNQDDFTPSGFFALRTPLLPFDDLLAWGEGLEAPRAGGDPASLNQALVTDRVRLRARLRAVVERPEVREALFVASPDLDGRLDVWLRQPESEAGQKMERALVRYFQRMAARATPFGLFAGCSVGTLAVETRLALDGRDRYQRHTRLDMDYLVALAEALEREPAVRRCLRFQPNSSLYRLAGRVRFTEYRRNGKGHSHCVVVAEDSEDLRMVLTRAERGAEPGVLAAALVETDPDASAVEAEEDIGDLIDSHALVSELAPTVTGPEPVPALAARLRERGASAAAERLEQARQAIEAIDAAGLGNPAARYDAVARLLASLPAKVEPGKLFQVDLVKPAPGATLGTAVVQEIVRGVHILQRLARRPAEDDLARFRTAFLDRYQGQDPAGTRWVPLVEALDDETGIGFGTAGSGGQGAALLDDLAIPAPGAGLPTPPPAVAWGKREAFLLRQLGEALASGAPEIRLGPDDLAELEEPEPLPLPDTFAALAAVAAPSEAALARGDFRVLLEGIAGPSGACLLGRFCHADPELRRHVEDHLRAEEALEPDAVFAEVVHLPEEGRTGNVILRPVLRAYEIPYLGQSGVPAERQIPVTDLLVAVRGDQVVLRSQRLGRRVIPRLTSAHNFLGRGQGVYRFLCLLQGQWASPSSWDWGALRSAPFLPRVVSGRLVLARARWLADKQELKDLGAARGSERFRAVQRWRAARRLPRWLALADHDNEMPIDLDNVLSVDTFVELVKGRDQATLVEMFPEPDQLCAHGPEGRFVHELVVPFVRQRDRETERWRGREAGRQRDKETEEAEGAITRAESVFPLPVSLSLCLPVASARRRFPPGSDWLYAKLYTGPATADQVLRDVIRPVVDQALCSRAADGWFFVRYGDPDWHLRLRFHGEPGRLHAEVLPALQAAMAPLLGDGRVWRLQFDTYEREVERYGGPKGIVLAERLFQIDSEAVLTVSDRLAEDARGELRWRLALCGMDLLLTDLGFDLDAKRAILRRAREAFAREFRADVTLKRQLGERFRKEGKELEALLCSGLDADGPLAFAGAALRRRSERLGPVAARLRACAGAGRLSHSLAELAPSYLHMHANRLLRSAQRAQEMVLYDFLHRLYESRAARAASGAKPTRAD
jgi:thiopeptide-type bacteriocin biosynthesis protein